MRKILIITNAQDAHAQAVADCLVKKGAVPVRWFCDEFLINQKAYYRINNNCNQSLVYYDNCSIDLLDVDVVWYRRAKHARLVKNIDPLDYEFVEAENRSFMKSLWMILGEGAKWVNPYESFERSNSKILQLREAVRIDLVIPDTLVTNDRNNIAKFILENKDIGVIYKTFFPGSWEEDASSFQLYSTHVTCEMLPDDNTMALTPGIYQARIQKKYEIRATFFDEQYVAVKIDNSDEIDWRNLQGTSKFNISAIQLPSEIEKKCILLMKQLGIVFGCFDFIVTPKDEYVFLEVNEMGQFLWIEELLPELHLLDLFCEFLLYNKKEKKDEGLSTKSFTLSEIFSSHTHQNMRQLDEQNYQRNKNYFLDLQ